MPGGDAEAGNSYHFKTVDGPASTAVVEAVAFVTGLDPLDIEPLGRVLDTSALDRLVDSADRATVTFEYEGLSIEVGAGGDIHVASDDRLRSADRDFDRSNVLLVDGSDATADCSNHFDAVGVTGANVLGVTFSSPDEGHLDSWLSGVATAADATLISVGEVTRTSAGVASNPAGPAGPAVETVGDPRDLGAIEDRMARRLARWEGDGDRIVVCFDSVTALLERVGPDRTIEFLRSVTEQTRTADASAHFHLDGDRYAGEFAESVSSLFDAVVTVGPDGQWTVDGAQRE